MILSILVGITSSLDTIPGVWVLQVQGNTKVARVNFDNSRKLESQLTFIPNSVTGTGSTWQLKYIDVENGGRGRLLKSAADGKILFQTAISPAPYSIGPTKDTPRLRSSAQEAVLASTWLPKVQRFAPAILVWDSKGQWHTYSSASMWVPGRDSNELFLGQFDGDLSNSKTKMLKGWIVNRATGKGRAVSPTALRNLLWPAAKVAFDKFGAGPFFLNPIWRPGYATDPAYIVSGLDQYTDAEGAAAGKSAIVFPNGKIITKDFHWNPLIATTIRGKDMYVLTDDSYYNAMGWNEREVLHLMKVDPKHGLVRVASVKNATGVSYAFAE